MIKSSQALIFICSILLITACCKEDEPKEYGPFKDIFPITFIQDTILNLSTFKIYTPEKGDEVFSLPERSAELETRYNRAKKQIDNIKLLSPNKAEIRGYELDGVTPIFLEMVYSLDQSTYTFEKDLQLVKLKYQAFRTDDYLIMKGINFLKYNKTIIGHGTFIENEGLTLQDQKNSISAGDTLYYRTFEPRLIKM